jgi:protein-tyrosine phosphatase
MMIDAYCTGLRPAKPRSRVRPVIEETMPQSHEPIRVLFVCLGNICRSPMAEGVFRDMVERAGLAGRIVADSAGTSAYHLGEPLHPGTRRILQMHGIDLRRVARVISDDDLRYVDYIVAMDSDNLHALRRRADGAPVRLSLLLDYAPAITARDVPDPYYTGGFEQVYRLVEQGCRGLLAHIVREEGLDVVH